MADSKFYKVHPLFHPFPEETKPLQSVDRFGPVGIGIELHLPAFVMKVKNVEKDSPAEATGKLKPGQIIESINGQVLKDIDPRMQLGSIITQAEATDGKVKLLIRSTQGAEPEQVVVTIPVLGAYSKTWPLNCPKSDKIVRNMADYLAKSGNHAGPGLDMGLLFMLSTGEEQDLEVARGWIKELVANYKGGHAYPWHIGYGGPALCEYYLRTGDTSILPVIESLAEQAKKTMYNSGWNTHGNQPNYKYYSGGHMNAAGVHCVTFLLLAKECGVKVDEYTLQSSLKQFYRFAGKGNVAYGDHLPESGMVDNGKVGGLAFAMAAAASLTPDGEQSVYAKARDICAAKSFYSTSWMLHGHTGGGIGEIWRSAAMGLMHEKSSWTTGCGTTSCLAGSTARSAYLAESAMTSVDTGGMPTPWPIRSRVKHCGSPARRPPRTERRTSCLTDPGGRRPTTCFIRSRQRRTGTGRCRMWTLRIWRPMRRGRYRGD